MLPTLLDEIQARKILLCGCGIDNDIQLIFKIVSFYLFANCLGNFLGNFALLCEGVGKFIPPANDTKFLYLFLSDDLEIVL